MQTETDMGRQVIFLYPPTVMEEISQELIRREFEVYICKDHKKLERYLKQTPTCLTFINVDNGMDEKDWIEWVQGITNTSPTSGFGVITLNENPMLAKLFLMDVGVQCGFIVLKQGMAKATEIIQKTLDANEAKGRRRFLRANIESQGADCNFMQAGEKIQATIQDISSVGMAIHFLKDVSFKVGAKITDLQLNLKGIRVLLSAVVMVARKDDIGATVHVLLFDPATLDMQKKDKISSFIRRCLQDKFDAALEAL
jgi:hypothetical protein